MAEDSKEKYDSERNGATDSGADDVSKNEAPTDIVCDVIKGLDANRYATKKTVAQGMLDIALLTSNASQLKYVLQVGPKHEFYTLLVVLISISIVLQLLVGLLFVVIGGLDLNDHEDQPSALILNDVIVISAMVAVILSCIFNINHVHHQRKADILNNVSLLFKVLSITVNILISILYSIELDSKLI